MTAGAETDITLIPVAALTAGTYKATLTVSADGITSVSVDITYTVTPTANDALQATTLKAWTQNGLLHVSGLTAGKQWRVYSISGTLVYTDKATADKATAPLPVRGIYIVVSERQSIKVTY